MVRRQAAESDPFVPSPPPSTAWQPSPYRRSAVGIQQVEPQNHPQKGPVSAAGAILDLGISLASVRPTLLASSIAVWPQPGHIYGVHALVAVELKAE